MNPTESIYCTLSQAANISEKKEEVTDNIGGVLMKHTSEVLGKFATNALVMVWALLPTTNCPHLIRERKSG